MDLPSQARRWYFHLLPASQSCRSFRLPAHGRWPACWSSPSHLRGSQKKMVVTLAWWCRTASRFIRVKEKLGWVLTPSFTSGAHTLTAESIQQFWTPGDCCTWEQFEGIIPWSHLITGLPWHLQEKRHDHSKSVDSWDTSLLPMTFVFLENSTQDWKSSAVLSIGRINGHPLRITRKILTKRTSLTCFLMLEGPSLGHKIFWFNSDLVLNVNTLQKGYYLSMEVHFNCFHERTF